MKIYSLVYNYFEKVMYTSSEKEILQEIMCDMFLEGFQEECQVMVDNHYINMEEPDECTYTMIQET